MVKMYPYENKIFNEDYLDFAKQIQTESIDLILEDPPYGVDFKTELYNDSQDYVESNIDEWFKEKQRMLKPHHHIYLFVPTLLIDLWVEKTKKYFTFNNLISTRVYGNGVYAGLNNFQFDTQLLIYASKGKAQNFNIVNYQKTSDTWLTDKRNSNPKEYSYNYASFFKMISSINIENEVLFNLLDKLFNQDFTLPSSNFVEPRSNIKANADIKRRHSNEKNPLFLKILIMLSTYPQELVMDGYAGSGSTAKACQLCNRKYVVNDKNTELYNAMLERLEGKYKNGIITNKIIY